MSVAYFVVLEREVVGLNTTMDGKALAHAGDLLDELSLELDVPMLSEFSQVDGELMREVIGEMAGMPEFADLREGLAELDTQDFEGEDWFDPSDGLRWTQAMRQHLPGYLGQNPAALEDLEGFTLEQILADLSALERILEGAQAEKVRFHLALDF